jgi:hypothetical protein
MENHKNVCIISLNKETLKVYSKDIDLHVGDILTIGELMDRKRKKYVVKSREVDVTESASIRINKDDEEGKTITKLVHYKVEELADTTLENYGT